MKLVSGFLKLTAFLSLTKYFGSFYCPFVSLQDSWSYFRQSICSFQSLNLSEFSVTQTVHSGMHAIRLPPLSYSLLVEQLLFTSGVGVTHSLSLSFGRFCLVVTY